MLKSNNSPNRTLNHSTNSMEELVSISNQKMVTTSLKMSNLFRKRHKNVLRDIDNLISQLPENQRKHNFVPLLKIRQLPNGGYKEERYFELTRDAFTLLAMGFTGKNALKFKLKYIEAFNFMEELLTKQAMVVEPFMGVCPLVDEHKAWYCYLDVLKSVGNSTTSGSVSERKRRYPKHFKKFYGRNFVDRAFCEFLKKTAEVRHLQLNLFSNPKTLK